MRLTQIPKITNRQKEILNLLYSHRFLNRKQIQAFLKHKDKKTINQWLKDLRDKDYIRWIYNKDHFAEKTKPAIYYLGINGIRQLRQMDFHPIEEIRKRYRDYERSQTFIDRSLVIADCCINLEQARSVDDFPHTWYYYETEADYLSDNYYHFMSENELIHPHLCFSKEQYNGGGEDPYTVKSLLLEVFDMTLPRYRLRSRLKKYVEYLNEELTMWESEINSDPPPIILLVCATLTDLIYAKRRTRGLMAIIWDYGDQERPHIRFTTIDKLKEFGVLGKIWEEA